MSQDENQLKTAAAESAAAQVTDGMIIGLGSGSTAALALITGIGFGLLPAMQATRPNMYPTLKDQGGSVIGGFDSIYVITRENGHWGVKARSSFAP